MEPSDICMTPPLFENSIIDCFNFWLILFVPPETPLPRKVTVWRLLITSFISILVPSPAAKNTTECFCFSASLAAAIYIIAAEGFFIGSDVK